MPKLPVIKPKTLIKALEQVGFVVDHVTGSHYVLYDSIRERRAVVPFARKDIPKGTLLSILRSSGLTKKELREILQSI